MTPSNFIPAVPDNKTNYGQAWTRSTERDMFATLRGEWDVNAMTTATAWAAARKTISTSRASYLVTSAPRTLSVSATVNFWG